MKRIPAILVFFVAGVVFSIFQACAQPGDVPTGVSSKPATAQKSSGKPPIYDFAKGTDAESDAEAMKIVESYRRTVALLIEQLKRRRLTPQRRIHVVYALGTLRALSAIDPLIDCVELQNPEYTRIGVIRGGIPRWGEYPAAGALTKIGYPAVYRILKRLPEEHNDLRRRLLCSVIIGVAGSDHGKRLIERAADSTKDILKRRRLHKTLESFSPFDG